jgi:hypothetical protein
VGILEDFYAKHPDFGRGGFFAIMASAPFAWPNADDQRPYMREKVQWLVDHGYEIGNHTIDHVNLREISNEEVKAQLAGAVEIMRGYAPKAQMEIIAVPFGVYPKGGNTTLFEGFDYQGKHYGFQAALMVGANPGPRTGLQGLRSNVDPPHPGQSSRAHQVVRLRRGQPWDALRQRRQPQYDHGAAEVGTGLERDAGHHRAPREDARALLAVIGEARHLHTGVLRRGYH